MGILLKMGYSHTQPQHSSVPMYTQPFFDDNGDPTSTPSSSPSSSFFQPHLSTSQQVQELGKDEMRLFMQTNSLKGAKMAKSRQPYVGEVLPFESPVDPEVEFGIRRIGNREHIAYRNLSSKIRYIQSEGDDTYVSEKDYPAGDMSISTILLALVSWNIEDPSGHIVEINRDNLIAYTQPEELEALHEKVLEVNPVLTGKDKAKNS